MCPIKTRICCRTMHNRQQTSTAIYEVDHDSEKHERERVAWELRICPADEGMDIVWVR